MHHTREDTPKHVRELLWWADKRREAAEERAAKLQVAYEAELKSTRELKRALYGQGETERRSA